MERFISTPLLLTTMVLVVVTLLVNPTKGLRVKHLDLRCAQCNMKGDNPEECNGDAGKKGKFCDPEDAYVKMYFGCATVLGTDKNGKRVVSKGCVADCTERCLNFYLSERVTLKDSMCVPAMDEKTSKKVTECWVHNGKMLMSQHHKIDKFCFCDGQECNVNDKNIPIGGSVNGAGCSTNVALVLPLLLLAVLGS